MIQILVQHSRGLLFLISALTTLSVTPGLRGQEATNTSAIIPSVSASYVISPLDYLRVSLFVADEPQFGTEVRVSQNGTITLPHLGNVSIAGLSLEDAREMLFKPYDADFYVNPHIDITVLAYAERTVTVIGKVNRQGVVPIPSEQGISLLEAIAMAGGWSADRLADMRNITITRNDSNGEKYVIKVDARNITTGDHPLKDGDLISVPERVW